MSRHSAYLLLNKIQGEQALNISTSFRSSDIDRLVKKESLLIKAAAAEARKMMAANPSQEPTAFSNMVHFLAASQLRVQTAIAEKQRTLKTFGIESVATEKTAAYFKAIKSYGKTAAFLINANRSGLTGNELKQTNKFIAYLLEGYNELLVQEIQYRKFGDHQTKQEQEIKQGENLFKALRDGTQFKNQHQIARIATNRNPLISFLTLAYSALLVATPVTYGIAKAAAAHSVVTAVSAVFTAIAALNPFIIATIAVASTVLLVASVIRMHGEIGKKPSLSIRAQAKISSKPSAEQVKQAHSHGHFDFGLQEKSQNTARAQALPSASPKVKVMVRSDSQSSLGSSSSTSSTRSRRRRRPVPRTPTTGMPTDSQVRTTVRTPESIKQEREQALARKAAAVAKARRPRAGSAKTTSKTSQLSSTSSSRLMPGSSKPRQRRRRRRTGAHRSRAIAHNKPAHTAPSL